MSANPITAMPSTGTALNPKPVVIDNDNGHVPSPFDYQHLNRYEDEAVWVSLNGSPFTVHFDPRHTPFNDHIFKVPAGGTRHSGPVIRGEHGEEFKYSVDGPVSSTDPKIIVDP